MVESTRYDIIIIGTGAGGGTLARRLAPTGLRILLLERGDFLPRERENWDTREVFERKRYLAQETWYDKDGAPFRPYTHYCVGGNTKMYGAALLRMREHDFGEVRHFGGISPAWPVTYAEMEPYYAAAEAMYSVHGQRGLDPCEPQATGPFPFGPLEPEPRIAELYEDLKSLGYRPFPIPLALRPGDEDRGAAPRRLGLFDGYPDVTEAKADAHVIGIRPALRHPNVTLLTRALVEQLETGPTGREIDRVVVLRDGERLEFGADTIVVSCGAINSAALLLRSASERHPHGLANGSGLVGRNYMTHQNGCFIAVSDEPNDSAFQKHFGLTEFYRGADDSDYPLGTIQLMGKPDPGTLEWLKGDRMPGVSVADIVPRTFDFFLTAEDLPDPGNRVSLRDDGSLRISYTPNNTEAYDRLQRKLAEALHRVDQRRGRRPSTHLAARLGVSGVSHQSGTLRFGTDPTSSVLDINCRAHDVDNLYVVDASFFPSSSAVNPSLTIMANALRVGDHLAERLTSSRRIMEGSMV